MTLKQLVAIFWKQNAGRSTRTCTFYILGENDQGQYLDVHVVDLSVAAEELKNCTFVDWRDNIPIFAKLTPYIA